MSETNKEDTEQDSVSEEQPKEYTKAEMKEMQDKRTAFYKEEIKHLKPHAEYEKLLAEIEESKFRGYNAMARSAQLFAQAEQAQQEAESAAKQPVAPNPERKLKTEQNV